MVLRWKSLVQSISLLRDSEVRKRGDLMRMGCPRGRCNFNKLNRPFAFEFYEGHIWSTPYEPLKQNTTNNFLDNEVEGDLGK